jgi:hypothetical protein
MPRKLILAAIVAIALFLNGCQTASNTNTAPGANANSSPLPPGIQTSPITPGGTPTPGIPDVNAPKNQNQPAGTPTPGIPDLKSEQNSNRPKLDEKTTPSKGNVNAPGRNLNNKQP